jgi:DNA-binding response OmpR family regulator
MAKTNILIVEDQRDLARMLQSGLKAAAPDTNVLNVPSAEEALLVAGLGSFDVLIIDVILPGISGLDLMPRLKSQQPAAKTILLTGSSDHEIRKLVANAGADAFFFKPVEISAILEAIERFNAGAAPSPLPAMESEPEEPEQRLDEQLANLRRALEAFSVILLDDRGRTLIQAGDLPPGLDAAVLYPALMGAFSAAARVSSTLGARTPEDILVIPGGHLELYLAHVGEVVALVAVLPKDGPGGGADVVVPIIQEASADLRQILVQIGVPSEVVEEPALPGEAEEEIIEEDPAAAEELESLLAEAGEVDMSADEIDAYWESPAKSTDTGSLHPDSLTYDQARKIGLAPHDE